MLLSRKRLALFAISCLVLFRYRSNLFAVRFERRGNTSAHSLRCSKLIGSEHVPRRILYNINHLKLISNEVPLLLTLGYEVYIPKHLPSIVGEANSAGIVRKYDESLTISERDLALLDSHNFYEEKSWGSDVVKLINDKFCMVITASYMTPIAAFLSRLSLPIGIRVFGHALPDTYSRVFPADVKELVMKHERRVTFLSAYPHLAEVEEEFKGIFRFAPVTLKPEGPYFQRSVTKKAVLFQCSRINVSPHYTEKATKFLSDFSGSGINYTMYGTERSRFNISHNLGRPSSVEINGLFASYAAMYYDSIEPRHLHYHPLEAMQAQMPVIFLQEGMLSRLMPYSPAKSRDVREAQRKLQRLIKGDAALENEIVWHQNVLLQSTKNSNNLDEWRAVLSEVGCGAR